MNYFIELSTYHRLVSPSRTLEDIQKQIDSLEIWGGAAHNFYQSDIPKVKAYSGKLPENQSGIEFTTDIPPDPNIPPGLATWSGNRTGRTHLIRQKKGVRMNLLKSTYLVS